jgi:hypothetical protein
VFKNSHFTLTPRPLLLTQINCICKSFALGLSLDLVVALPANAHQVCEIIGSLI